MEMQKPELWYHVYLVDLNVLKTEPVLTSYWCWQFHVQPTDSFMFNHVYLVLSHGPSWKLMPGIKMSYHIILQAM